MIGDWVNEVLASLGQPLIDVSRNLDQTRAGGYDLLSVPWLAVEVKRHENLQVSQWWKQAVKQAGPEQTPFLMYRQNRTPWRFRIQMTAYHVGPAPLTALYPVDMDAATAKQWLQMEVWSRQRTLD